jgi:hypothetical protein
MNLKTTVTFVERDLRLALVDYFTKNNAYPGFVINANDVEFTVTEFGKFSASVLALEKAESTSAMNERTKKIVGYLDLALKSGREELRPAIDLIHEMSRSFEKIAVADIDQMSIDDCIREATKFVD